MPSASSTARTDAIAVEGFAPALDRAEAGPGDFIFVPPYVPHQEINALPDEELHCVLVRSDQEPVVVNLDIPVIEESGAEWIDPIHPARQGQ